MAKNVRTISVGKISALLSGIVLLIVTRLAGAAPPVLLLPIECHLGVDCYIQSYFDHDPGPGWLDYACGVLTYDGHAGTDFRTVDSAAMESGVNVLAAVAGIIVATRDGEPDISVSRRGRSNLNNKDAGNSVRITHGEGWETQYSHLKRGSVAVRVGQHVEAGMVLGQVGLSGNTEFPHVDFSVRRNGQPVDPFAPDGNGCLDSRRTLWDRALATALSYRPTGLLIAGFAAKPPERDRAEAGEYAKTELTAQSKAVAFWVELFGLRKEDLLEISLTDPSGQLLAKSTTTADRNKAVWFGFVGKRRGTAAWDAGIYNGYVVLRRGTTVVIDEARTVAVH